MRACVRACVCVCVCVCVCEDILFVFLGVQTDLNIRSANHSTGVASLGDRHNFRISFANALLLLVRSGLRPLNANQTRVV